MFETLTKQEKKAVRKALENCSAWLDYWYEVEQYYNDNTVTINTCRNGKDVAWCIWSETRSSCIYVDNLEELTEEEIEKELC